MKRGDFCHRLVESWDLQNGGIFTKKRMCFSEDTPVTPIKELRGALAGKNTYITIFNTHFP